MQLIIRGEYNAGFCSAVGTDNAVFFKCFEKKKLRLIWSLTLEPHCDLGPRVLPGPDEPRWTLHVTVATSIGR